MKFIDKRANTISILNEALKQAVCMQSATGGGGREWSPAAHANCEESVQLIRRAIKHLEIVPKTPDRLENSI